MKRRRITAALILAMTLQMLAGIPVMGAELTDRGIQEEVKHEETDSESEVIPEEGMVSDGDELPRDDISDDPDQSKDKDNATVEVKAMYRLYNTISGEHLYTADKNERRVLVKMSAWNYEGIGWFAPVTSNTPVYRLYNPKTGGHHYTKDANEKNVLTKSGAWKYEGIGWYSDDNKTIPLYRQFNPRNKTGIGMHNYTKDANENRVLTTQMGWIAEGIAWYGLNKPEGFVDDMA